MTARPRFGLISLALLAVFLSFSFISTRQVQANSSVSVNISVFHDALAPYGNWINHRTYGQVWYPHDVARDWRPYTDGYWAHTDEYGWLWVSNEPWGWAPFHYGRWAWDNWYGWVWVPGRTWAPAWVFWRSGGGYAAWAPMPPNVVWQPNIGLNISYFNYDRDLRWDSWVAVREHDLPYRNMSRRICPPHQNLQIINVTNNINNVTIVNDTIVNQGIPVKQIEALTGKPVVSVVPTVQDTLSVNTTGHNEDQPNIIRLPLAPSTPEETPIFDERARQLDGKNPDGTRTEPPVVNPAQPGNQEPRVAGRLAGEPAPVQSPYATPEQPNPLSTEPVEQALPQPAIPETPLVGLGLDSGTQHKKPEVGSNLDALVPLQPADQQPLTTSEPTISPPLQTDGALVPAPVADQQSVSTDAAPLPPQQNEPQSLESAKQSDVQPLQAPVADQQQIQQQQTENSQRQQQIDQLQEELAHGQDKNTQQEIKMQLQQAQPVQEEAQQIQQQEAARQQDMQNQQQLEMQQQQAQRAQEQAQQTQQQEAARQQDIQNQQQLEIQQQQAQRAQEQAQQMQQQEAARQQDIQNQQKLEMQQQQAQRAQEQAQQTQQQEAARQQDIQNQQQLEIQQQQAQRAQEEALQIQQQEAARQQDIQNQQQLEMQQQQAQRAQEQAQQMQQQEAARQQDMQNQQQLEIQQQQAQRAQEQAQQMQQQEAARQQDMQNQQQLEKRRQQTERERNESQQMQKQQELTPQ